MSHENVDLVRTVCTPWERGDFSSVEWAHHEIEFAFADGPTPATKSADLEGFRDGPARIRTLGPTDYESGRTRSSWVRLAQVRRFRSSQPRLDLPSWGHGSGHAFKSRLSPKSSGLTTILAFVPRISEFYGIVIAMYFRDHNPPHLHARYAGQEAKVAIATGELIEGEIPGRAYRLVREWVELHREELELNWERARSRTPLVTIDPLP